MNTKNILAFAGLAIVVLATVMSFNRGGKDKPKPARETATAEVAEAETTAAPELPRSLTITAVGDCTFATDVNAVRSLGFDAYAEKYGTEYFLANVRDIFSEDDLTIVNFEGTLSYQGTRENKQFAFRGDPAYVNVLTSSSVEAANLANNHSADYGEVSLTDTKLYLDQAGILNCRGRDNVCVTDINGIKVGLVGINYLNDVMKTELEDAIRKAKDMGAELVILSIHWGIEKMTSPTEEQINTAHRAIDCGADLVIGTHPHVLEGVEKYNGRYILYSLGNFCFGGNNAPSDMDSMIWRQTFMIDNNGLIDDDHFEIIPCRISNSAGFNDYQPTPAEGDAAERIKRRLREYSAPLGDVYLKFRGEMDV